MENFHFLGYYYKVGNTTNRDNTEIWTHLKCKRVRRLSGLRIKLHFVIGKQVQVFMSSAHCERLQTLNVKCRCNRQKQSGRTLKCLWRDQHLSSHSAQETPAHSLSAEVGMVGVTGSLQIALSGDWLHWAFRRASGGPPLCKCYYHTCSAATPTRGTADGFLWLQNRRHASFG